MFCTSTFFPPTTETKQKHVILAMYFTLIEKCFMIYQTSLDIPDPMAIEKDKNNELVLGKFIPSFSSWEFYLN